MTTTTTTRVMKQRDVPSYVHSASRSDWLASREFEEQRMKQIEERSVPHLDQVKMGRWRR